MWKVHNFKYMRRAESGNKRKRDTCSNGCGMTVSYYLITMINVWCLLL